MRAWIVLLLIAGGCFEPKFKNELGCDVGGACPPGMTCGSDNICRSAQPIDAAPPDAFRFTDAMPVDCTTDDDCQDPPNGCLFAGVCNVAEGVCDFSTVDCSSLDSECTVGMCNPDTGACVATEINEGGDCGAGTMCQAFGPCGTFSGTCDSSGEQSRDCTSNTCQAGTCVAENYVETAACTRVTEGVDCGTDTVTSCGTCGSFSNTCDESGSHTCTCTDFKCVSDSCQAMSSSCTQSCARDTDGVACGSTQQTNCGTCAYSTACDRDATDVNCTCTTPRCVAGGCTGSSQTSCVNDCERDTTGNECCLPCGGGEPRAGTCSSSGVCANGGVCGSC